MYFRTDDFFKGKTFLTTDVKPLTEYGVKNPKIIGTKVEVVIWENNTEYDGKDGGSVSNKFEKLLFKTSKDLIGKIPVNCYVVPVNPVAKVYGEYNNQLSITCDDITIDNKNSTSTTPLASNKDK